MIAEITSTVTLKPDVPALAAAESWTVATDIAEALARFGTPSIRPTNSPVASSSNPSIKAKGPSIGPPPSSPPSPRIHPRNGRIPASCPRHENRQVPGGTAPSTVAAALVEAATRLNEFRP